METKHSLFKKLSIISILLLCVVIVSLGGWAANSRRQTASPINHILINNFDRTDNPRDSLVWAVANQAGRTELRQQGGVSFLQIEGPISAQSNLKIIGSKANINDADDSLDTAVYEGIYFKAKGTAGRWIVGFWIDAEGGARLYQAPLDLKAQWQEYQLPFRMFRATNSIRPADSRELVRIESLTSAQPQTLGIFLDEFGFYREHKMYKKLNAAETRVIVQKGTERPFTGEYDDHFEEGIYTCKRCDAPLYKSTSKFKSGCGWPSFDEQIDGAVKWQPDANGVRTEILCNQCGAHLGHVFLGEGYTQKNVRHCVNSISMNFVPAPKEKTAKAIFASGCFWGTEYYFNKAPGVISTTVGYTGGHVDNPTYQQVCTDQTGHAESVEVVFDTTKTSYEQLAKLFFETHDFTQLNRQGPDIGKRYRSAIFYLNDEQKEIATELVNILRKKGYNVKTEITKASKFWPAEDYHQDYYDKNHKAPYCHIYRKIF